MGQNRGAKDIHPTAASGGLLQVDFARELEPNLRLMQNFTHSCMWLWMMSWTAMVSVGHGKGQ